MTPEQLDKITTWAELYFTPKEICALEELSWEEMELRFIDEEDPVWKAYNKGVLKNKAEVRIKLNKLAKDGSPAAQQIIQKLIIDQTRGK